MEKRLSKKTATESDRLLRIMQQAILADVRTSTPDLTTRQLTLLLTTYLDEGPHTVRQVASHMNVSKPTISRALDRLSELRMMARLPDPKDRRSILIAPTDAGKAFVRNYRATMAAAAKTYEAA